MSSEHGAHPPGEGAATKVTITDAAREELARIASVSDLDPDIRLRLTTPPVWEGEGDFGIVKDGQRVDDHLVEYQGDTVLLIDPVLAQHLSKSVLDFKDFPQGVRFTLDVY